MEKINRNFIISIIFNVIFLTGLCYYIFSDFGSTSTINDLRRTIESQRTTIISLEQSNKQFGTNIDELQRNTDRLEESNKQLEFDNNRLKAANNGLENTIDELRAINNRFEESEQLSGTAIEKLKKIFDEVEGIRN